MSTRDLILLGILGIAVADAIYCRHRSLAMIAGKQAAAIQPPESDAEEYMQRVGEEKQLLGSWLAV